MYHVPLVPRDADHEETMFRIEQSLTRVFEVSTEIFDKIQAKIERVNEKALNMHERAEIIERKLEKINESKNVVTLIRPTRLPPLPKNPEATTSMFRINVTTDQFSKSELPEYKRADDHLLRPCEPVDFTRELSKTDKFFLTSSVLAEYDQKSMEKEKKRMLNGLRRLPDNRDDFHITDLFFAGTSIPAYEGVTGEFVQQHLDAEGTSTRRSGRKAEEEEENQQRLHEQLLEDTALSNGRLLEALDDDHPLAFKVESRVEHKMDLPESLPNLKGYAHDFTLEDLGIDDEMLADIPDVLPLLIPPTELFPPTAENSTNGNSTPPPSSLPSTEVFVLPPPPPPISVKIPEASFAPTPPPPPPPPLPPMLPPMTPDASVVTFSPTKSIDNGANGGGRADLMAAIRAAGGASNAKLNKIQEKPIPKRRGKYDNILETSALPTSSNGRGDVTPSPSGAGGGDLMSALSAALDARRKAINGSKEKAAKTLKFDDDDDAWD